MLRILPVAIFALAAGPLRAAFVANPSFEDNFTTSDNGGINPTDWDVVIGAWGVSETNSVFYYAPTAVPDRDRYAFIWHEGTITQEISGLTPGKQYWLQFWYEGRCCGEPALTLEISFGGAPIGAITSVESYTTAFAFANVAFTPTNDTGTLSFSTVTSGDASAYIDAVNIVQRDAGTVTAGNVVLMNPSFEASGPPTTSTGNPPATDSGEVIKPALMAGWLWDTNGTGTYGISLDGGFYADNGAIPDQDLVGFIAGPGSLSQTVTNLVADTSYQLTFFYNAQTLAGVNAHLQVVAAGTMIDDEDVAPVGGSNPYHTKTLTFTPTNTSAVISFVQTTANGVLLLDNVSLVGHVPAQYALAFSPTSLELEGTQVAQIQVTVPAGFLASSAADINISSPTPGVVGIVGANSNGVLTVHFAQGATNVQFFGVVGTGRGSSGLTVTATAGLNVVVVPTVTVFTSFVLNPSFEVSGPGAGPITAWTGGFGVNNSSGPFLDNGIIPDQAQVAVLQGSGGSNNLSQQVYALVPGKNYWLQFRYNASTAGGSYATVDLQVKLGGKVLASITNITAVGSYVGDVPFYFTNIVFVPTNASELLEFDTSPTVAGTTPALLLDAVSMVQRDADEIVIDNPSFEACGEGDGLNGQIPPPQLVEGWSTVGTCGCNSSPLGPIADNGITPDQSEVLWIYQTGSVSNLISGLKVGQVYTLFYRINARCCSALTYDVAFGDLPLLTAATINPVGDGNPYLTQYVTFTNDAPSNPLSFTTEPVNSESMMLDDIHLVPGVRLPPPPVLTVSQSAGMVVITWPVAASGFVLQETSSLLGGWTNSAAAVTVQGPANVVTVSPIGKSKFYRLEQ
jgi:hypothetical protein